MKKFQRSSKPPRTNQEPFFEEKIKEFVLGAEKNKKPEKVFLFVSIFSRAGLIID